jgi:hypothetical protein
MIAAVKPAATNSRVVKSSICTVLIQLLLGSLGRT